MISDKKNKYCGFENIFPFYMDTVDDLIVIISLDNSFKIEYVHESRFLKRLGYSNSSLHGKSLFKIIDFGNDAPKKDFLRIFQQHINKQDVKIINKNSKFTWAELNSKTFIDEKNQQKILIILKLLKFG